MNCKHLFFESILRDCDTGLHTFACKACEALLTMGQLTEILECRREKHMRASAEDGNFLNGPPPSPGWPNCSYQACTEPVIARGCGYCPAHMAKYLMENSEYESLEERKRAVLSRFLKGSKVYEQAPSAKGKMCKCCVCSEEWAAIAPVSWLKFEECPRCTNDERGIEFWDSSGETLEDHADKL